VNLVRSMCSRLIPEIGIISDYGKFRPACKDAPYTPYIAPVSRRGISSVIGPFGAVAKRGAFSFLAPR